LKPLQNLPFPKTIEEQQTKIITLTIHAFRKASAHLKILKRNNMQQITQALHIHTTKSSSHNTLLCYKLGCLQVPIFHLLPSLWSSLKSYQHLQLGMN
jgi:hypothetical protein